jgi:hypothetical protein
MFLFFCPVEGRKLKNLILSLLKSQCANQVIRQNYAQSYVFQDGKLQRQQAKLLFVIPNPEKREKILQMVMQQVPTAKLLSENL